MKQTQHATGFVQSRATAAVWPRQQTLLVLAVSALAWALGLGLVLSHSAAQAEDATVSEEVELFNGRDYTGWTTFPAGDNNKLEDVWSVQDGMMVCKGKPIGYLRTEKDYENYVLDLEWRFPAGSEGGNSGVLVHTTDPSVLGVWPKCFECQLRHGNAGEILVIGTTLEMDNAEDRVVNRRYLRLVDDQEKPVGEWNQMRITCRGDEIDIDVNGTHVIQVKKCSQTKGAICLQSEGAEIHFRNLKLRPLAASEATPGAAPGPTK